MKINELKTKPSYNVQLTPGEVAFALLDYIRKTHQHCALHTELPTSLSDIQFVRVVHGSKDAVNYVPILTDMCCTSAVPSCTVEVQW